MPRTTKKETLKWKGVGKFLYENGGDVPVQQTPGSAGYDLPTDHDVYVNSSIVTLVCTGWAVQIPKGYVGLVTLRSSVAHKFRLSMMTSGVIDSDYRGEIKVHIIQHKGAPCCSFQPGERMFQMVVVPCLHLKSERVDELDPTERGENGWGSTG